MIDVRTSRAAIHALVAAWRKDGLRTGFVPTMGALHEGHLALVRASLAATDRTVVSIFVNPLQFCPEEDLARYPRPIERDRALLEGAGAHALYLPTVAEMYPSDAETRVSAERTSAPLCGAFRPGHFTGVLTVVLKLFNQVRPDVAFFGQKDYQQTAVLRRMVADLDLDLDLDLRVEPTSREPDGLARSSRNVYLAPEERRVAPDVKRALDAVAAAFAAGEARPDALVAAGRAVLDRSGAFRVQYFEIRDPATLAARSAPVRRGDLVAVAAHLGATRLIDNILI